MIEQIIKRDGRIEAFSPDKLNRWSEWAAQHLGGFVDWAGIAMRAVAKLPKVCESQVLQQALIQECLDQKSWAYYRMAARLYVSLLRKRLYGEDLQMPSVREVQKRLVDAGLMRELQYDDEEWAQIETFIQHKRDYNYAYFQIKQIVEKYSLFDRREQSKDSAVFYETPQYVFMRLAMALAEDEPSSVKLMHLKKWYDHLSCNRLNAPTPNFVNLGTTHNGYASCCLYVAADNERSLGIGDHIARTMTVASAGIGGALLCRSINDPVRGGLIVHQGKIPYYNALAGAVNSSVQNGRGGACTTYFSIYDPEVMTLMNLRHPKSPEDKRILTMDFAVCLNKHIVRKALRNEDVFLFNAYTAPDLVEAFYSGEPGRFEEAYARYEQDPTFEKQYVSARQLVITAVNVSIETGSLYLFFADEVNRHTPFKDPIYSSNLCVAPETPLLTRNGYFPISQLKDKNVEVWNGEQWSRVNVRLTGVNQRVVTVFVSNGKQIDCTKYHKWYVLNEDGESVETQTNDLKPGDVLEPWVDETGQRHENVFIVAVRDFERYCDTYCVNEPLRHKVIFNGVLTGNCAEIVEPTAPYYEMTDLYRNSDAGFVSFTYECPGFDQYGVEEGELNAHDPIEVEGKTISAIDMQPGMVIKTPHNTTIQIVDVLHRRPEPEVALCSLAAIVPSYIENDEQYADVAYYALKMIDKCIHMSDFPLEHVGFTAKKRLSAGVGLTGVAHYLAKRRLKYTSQEGKKELHRLAERHAYFLIRASLRLAKELGNAPWIHRTKWPEGWLPIDTYEKRVDDIAQEPLHYDWESLRQEIIQQGGIRNSTLIAHMPTESSSKASGVPNGLYPIRDFTLGKTDNKIKLDWAPTDGDKLRRHYQIAWDIPYQDMLECYAIVQKFTDQAISADQWVRLEGDSSVYTEDLLKMTALMAKLGIKTRYYFNSKTSQQTTDQQTGQVKIVEMETSHSLEDKCASGGCDA